MSTPAIAALFVTLLLIGGYLLFGDSADTPVPATHVMPDGTMMNDSDPAMETMPRGSHMMPDGTMMMDEASQGTHAMPDGTTMMNSDVRTETETSITPPVMSNPASTPAPMDHSMMGHTM
jgi:hypothetical protein